MKLSGDCHEQKNQIPIYFSATTIGITPAQTLTAAILGRLVSFLVLFSLGPIFTHYLVKYEPNPGERSLEFNPLP